MYRTLLLATVAAALALPAAAATSVKVNIDGLDAKAAHTAILRAAQAACRVELSDEFPLELFYDRPECLNDAIGRAEASLPAATASAAATPQTRVASR
ncbi:MAG TPA: hypothetical protein VGL73_07170 [Caulobacteraceae bacterium]|jgi:hypothetical protein